jgi:hypothetical protein
VHLFFFLRAKAACTLCGSLAGPVGLGIDIGNPNSAVRTASPSSTNQNVTTVLIPDVAKESFTEFSLFSSSDFTSRLRQFWILGSSQTADLQH